LRLFLGDAQRIEDGIDLLEQNRGKDVPLLNHSERIKQLESVMPHSFASFRGLWEAANPTANNLMRRWALHEPIATLVRQYGIEMAEAGVLAALKAKAANVGYVVKACEGMQTRRVGVDVAGKPETEADRKARREAKERQILQELGLA
jgi:hypothetical protein